MVQRICVLTDTFYSIKKDPPPHPKSSFFSSKFLNANFIYSWSLKGHVLKICIYFIGIIIVFHSQILNNLFLEMAQGKLLYFSTDRECFFS